MPEQKQPRPSFLKFLSSQADENPGGPPARASRSSTIRASEIGSFLFCRRAWWYQRQGQPSENQAELAAGTQMHVRHGRAVLIAGTLRLIGYLLFLFALVLLVIHLTSQLL